MQMIRVMDLKFMLNKRYNDKQYVTTSDLSFLLEHYGDSWFLEDGKWKLANENKSMKAMREQHDNYK